MSEQTLKVLTHKRHYPCNPTPFSCTEAFQNEVEPYLDKIRLACLKHKIPFEVCFAVENTMNETKYYADGLFAGVSLPKVELANDVLPEVLLAVRGAEFNTTPLDDPAADFLQYMNEDLPVDLKYGLSDEPREESISRIVPPDEDDDEW